MSAIKTELIDYINKLPDYKLIALKPMFQMISTDELAIIEKIRFDDLEEDERQAILQSRKEFENGEYYSHDEIYWDNLDKMNLD